MRISFITFACASAIAAATGCRQFCMRACARRGTSRPSFADSHDVFPIFPPLCTRGGVLELGKYDSYTPLCTFQKFRFLQAV